MCLGGEREEEQWEPSAAAAAAVAPRAPPPAGRAARAVCHPAGPRRVVLLLRPQAAPLPRRGVHPALLSSLTESVSAWSSLQPVGPRLRFVMLSGTACSGRNLGLGTKAT